MDVFRKNMETATARSPQFKGPLKKAFNQLNKGLGTDPPTTQQKQMAALLANITRSSMSKEKTDPTKVKAKTDYQLFAEKLRTEQNIRDFKEIGRLWGEHKATLVEESKQE